MAKDSTLESSPAAFVPTFTVEKSATDAITESIPPFLEGIKLSSNVIQEAKPRTMAPNMYVATFFIILFKFMFYVLRLPCSYLRCRNNDSASGKINYEIILSSIFHLIWERERISLFFS